MELSKHCIPCENDTQTIAAPEIQKYMLELQPEWNVVDSKKLVRDFLFDGYSNTIDFVNQVANIAQEEGHHPVMHVFFSKVTIELWTHFVNGLTDNDFIMAAKIDDIYKSH
jgi:4a-hydroxytetrahydrobiopterin dehydratase